MKNLVAILLAICISIYSSEAKSHFENYRGVYLKYPFKAKRTYSLLNEKGEIIEKIWPHKKGSIYFIELPRYEDAEQCFAIGDEDGKILSRKLPKFKMPLAGKYRKLEAKRWPTVDSTDEQKKLKEDYALLYKEVFSQLYSNSSFSDGKCNVIVNGIELSNEIVVRCERLMSKKEEYKKLYNKHLIQQQAKYKEQVLLEAEIPRVERQTAALTICQ